MNIPHNLPTLENLAEVLEQKHQIQQQGGQAYIILSGNKCTVSTHKHLHVQGKRLNSQELADLIKQAVLIPSNNPPLMKLEDQMTRLRVLKNLEEGLDDLNKNVTNQSQNRVTVLVRNRFGRDKKTTLKKINEASAEVNRRVAIMEERVRMQLQPQREGEGVLFAGGAGLLNDAYFQAQEAPIQRENVPQNLPADNAPPLVAPEKFEARRLFIELTKEIETLDTQIIYLQKVRVSQLAEFSIHTSHSFQTFVEAHPLLFANDKGQSVSAAIKAYNDFCKANYPLPPTEDTKNAVKARAGEFFTAARKIHKEIQAAFKDLPDFPEKVAFQNIVVKFTQDIKAKQRVFAVNSSDPAIKVKQEIRSEKEAELRKLIAGP